MKKVLFLFAVPLVLATSVALAAQETYYVQSAKAKILNEPSFKSPVVREVQKGQTLIALGKEGNWIKVKIEFETGYVSALVVSKQPPMNRIAMIRAEDQELRQSVRRRASTYSSAAAARGLTQESRRRLSKDEKADYFNLQKVEAITVSREAVEKFLKGGAL